MDPKRAYNPKSQATVKDQDDEVCAVCFNFKPCGCDLDNLHNHPKYDQLVSGKDAEVIDEDELDYEHYVANCNIKGCYVLTKSEYQLLKGPLTVESLDLALRLAEENKVIVREEGLQEVFKRTLRNRRYYAINDDLLPHRQNFAIVGRYADCKVGSQTVSVNIWLNPIDQKTWYQLTGKEYRTMSNLAGLKEPEIIGTTNIEGVH